MKYNLVTVEGNIGAGKTTLARMLANDFNGRLVLEEFENNPFLPYFIQGERTKAFPTELYFMAERFQQPVDQVKQFYQQSPDRVDMLKQALLEKKAIKLIIEHSLIEEVTPDKDAASESPENKA